MIIDSKVVIITGGGCAVTITGDVNLTGGIEPLAPDTLAAPVQRNRESGGLAQVIRVDVQLDLDSVREVAARFVDHHVPAGHQK